MLQGFHAVPGCIVKCSLFRRGELIKENSGIGTVLLGVQVARRCPAAAVARGVLVSRLSAGLPVGGSIPPVFRLPPPDSIVLEVQIIRQLPEIDFAALFLPGHVLSAGGLSLIASPCHL